MLQLRLSLSRQSNPSILTAGLLPKLGRTQPLLLLPPPFLPEEEGEEGSMAVDDKGFTLSSTKRESCINGLATLLGGDPQKNGGDDANCVQLPPSPCSTSASIRSK